jgi:hypothetical protein
MGSTNQLLFIEKHAAKLEGPFLEVGSKDYGNTQDLRSRFRGQGEYVGVDMEEGPGVDLVLDLTKPFDKINRQLNGRRFNTVFCLSVLEHCDQPFLMADNLTRLLAADGRICISVPFSFQFHAYPHDFWRFTHFGIMRLFSSYDFELGDGAAATSKTGEFFPLDKEIGVISFGSKWHRRRGHPVRGFVAKGLHLLSKVGVLPWLTGYPYVLAPADLMMVGSLKPARRAAA